jgi:hypothetical protein
MLDPCATMTAFAVHPYLIHEIASFQKGFVFVSLQKYCTHKWNRMKLLLPLLIPLCSIMSPQCTKKTAGGLPQCVQDKIDAIKREPRWNPPAQVNEYVYRGKTVYLFTSNCCDAYNTAYDEDCNPVCAPSGGITGGGDRKCTDFDSTAKHVRLVWQDAR